MSEAAKTAVEISEYQHFSNMVLEDNSQKSGIADGPLLLFHLGYSRIVPGTDFQESIETVNQCNTWAKHLQREIILMGSKEKNACTFFSFHLCIFFSYISNVCNDGNRNNQMMNLLNYISSWFEIIDATDQIEDFVLQFADEETKTCISDWICEDAISITSTEGVQRELNVDIRFRHVNISKQEQPKSFKSISRHIAWVLEELFSRSRELDDELFKFHLTAHGTNLASRVSVKMSDDQGPSVSFYCEYDSYDCDADHKILCQLAKDQLLVLLKSSKILRYAANGFKVYLRPAVVHFHGPWRGHIGQEYAYSCFGFIRTDLHLDPGASDESGVEGKRRRTAELETENENAHIRSHIRYLADYMTKIQDQIATLAIKNHDELRTYTLFVLESRPGSILLSAEIPMWLLHIIEDICEWMDWSNFELPKPSIQIDWQAFENTCFLQRTCQKDTISCRVETEHKMWKDLSELVCLKCSSKVSDLPTASHFYGTTTTLSKMFSCLQTRRCSCCWQQHYLVCTRCQTGMPYKDTISAELHLLQCKGRGAMFISDIRLEESEARSVDLEADIFRLLRYKYGVSSGSLALEPTIKVDGPTLSTPLMFFLAYTSSGQTYSGF